MLFGIMTGVGGRRTLRYGGLVWLFFAAASTGTADRTPAMDFSHRDKLTGDWHGFRRRLDERGLDLAVIYTGDLISNVHGGLRTGTDYLDNLDMTLTCRTGELVGFDVGTIFLYGLFNHGGDPSARVGDAQGVDSIEAPDTAKLYEAWWQATFVDDKLSVLAGLYDLSSEFDAIGSASLFLNSSFGIGPELGQSGVNGVSNFPNTSLGLRLRTLLGSHLVWQAVVLDGVPGDPDDSHGTQICLDSNDGAFVASEAALLWQDAENLAVEDVPMTPIQRRRVGRGWGDLVYGLKLALGAWGYTAKQPLLASEDSAAPRKGHGHPGLYVLVDYDAAAWKPQDPRGVSVFARAGIADGDIGRFSAYLGGGIGYTGPVSSRPQDKLGFGVAAARNGDGFEHAVENDGLEATDFEVALEWTYRCQLTPWLVLQPDLQYVVDPGGIVGRKNAVVVGVRYEVSF